MDIVLPALITWNPSNAIPATVSAKNVARVVTLVDTVSESASSCSSKPKRISPIKEGIMEVYTNHETNGIVCTRNNIQIDVLMGLISCILRNKENIQIGKANARNMNK
ncbi:MAG: hypothetical protein WBC22_15310 [Sedimentisphaerales bacterium]